MKRPRKSPEVPLAQLKFKDLVATDLHSAERRLVNLKVPADILARVHHLARKLGVTKTAAIIALLNEGLQEAHRRGVGVKK
jgi:hypothetical protein